ncbi:MAG: hypothetical protein K2X39_10410 [Silvanigrellaceae bacterium]|nr:hypothetical protein [Silvanigrellaceae bacterium]
MSNNTCIKIKLTSLLNAKKWQIILQKKFFFLFYLIIFLNNSASFAETKTKIYGKILLPDQENYQSIKVRIAGLNTTVYPNSEGEFTFTDVPINSSSSFIVIDEEGKYNKRLFPFFAKAIENRFSIYLEKNSVMHDVSSLFKSSQSIVKTGFCGKILVDEQLEIYGGKVAVRKEGLDSHIPNISYFNANYFPDHSQKYLDENGRFCVFNLTTGFYKVTVSLKNRASKNFIIFLKDSFFETDLVFSMKENFVSHIQTYILRDQPSAFQMATNLSAQEQKMGKYGVNKWLIGLTHPIWQKVVNYSFSFNFSHSYKQYLNEDSFFIADISKINDFFYFNYKETYGVHDRMFLLYPDALVKEGKLCIYLLDTSIYSDFKKMFRKKNNLKNGTIFVYYDTKDPVVFSLIDVATHLSVSQFETILGAEKKNIGFFMNVPAGQYVLHVKDNLGNLRWFSLISAMSGKIQVLTNKFSCKMSEGS